MNSKNENIDERVCANCGAPVTGAFCSQCGQRAGQQRITLRSFFQSGAKELSKLNSGFFYTAWRVGTQPWNVIRDYINCRRVRYTSPISMLVALLIYYAIFASLSGVDMHAFGINIDVNGELEGVRLFVYNLVNSALFIYISLSIPIAGAVYLAHLNYGSRRYNAGEYMVAAVYGICLMIIYDIVSMPFKMINADIVLWIVLMLCVAMFVVSLVKAFRVPGLWRRVVVISACLASVAILIMLYVVVMSIIAQLIFDVA